MITIEKLQAREILDSRGQPTLEVACTTNAGQRAIAGVPAGASTGTREAVELRDGDPKRYGGRGVLKAVAAVNGPIDAALRGLDAADQRALDAALVRADSSARKACLGANALVGASMAAARAGAAAAGVPLYRHLGAGTRLPVPVFNVINGGLHAGWEGADFQEYMLIPLGAPRFAEALRWAAEIYRALKAVLKAEGQRTSVGDEGGFAPAVRSNRTPLDWLLRAITEAGLRPGTDIALGFDAAANGFRADRGYHLAAEARTLTSNALIAYYRELARDYPLVLLEDGLHEDDWDGWRSLTAALGARLTLVGDDIFVTQTRTIQRGLDLQAANAVLIKPNQVGTVSETLDAVQLAHGHGWRTMVSHRSGETSDSFIADLAVAVQAHFIKAGAPARGERVAKYNRLLAIEAELGSAARFAGGKP